jgi:predicted amidohydrolase YtcJ
MLLMGASSLPEVIAAGLKPGKGSAFLRVQGVKIRLDEASGALYPLPEMVNAQVWSAHCQGFPVAIHAVELPALVSALHAIRLAQARLPGTTLRHRIEHAALCPEVCIDELADLHVAIVTQPAFLWYHGRRYVSEIDPVQQPWLYRVKSLLARGVPVAAARCTCGTALPLEGCMPLWLVRRPMVISLSRRARQRGRGIVVVYARRGLGLRPGVGAGVDQARQAG